jgi:thiamine biosynthesis protein ThiC
VRIGDLAKYPDRRDSHKQAALARRDLRWDDLEQHLLFPQITREIRSERSPEAEDSCSMCGDFCAMKKGMEVFTADITHKTA